jgi:hypothetical protein
MPGAAALAIALSSAVAFAEPGPPSDPGQPSDLGSDPGPPAVPGSPADQAGANAAPGTIPAIALQYGQGQTSAHTKSVGRGGSNDPLDLTALLDPKPLKGNDSEPPSAQP